MKSEIDLRFEFSIRNLRSQIVFLILNFSLLIFFIGCVPQLQPISSRSPQEQIAHYAEIYRANPSSAIARNAQLQIGLIHYRQLNEIDRGIEILEKLIIADPTADETAEALWFVALHYFKQQNYKLAHQKFLQFSLDFAQNDRNRSARLLMAESLFHLENDRTALQNYLDYLDRYPNDRQNFPKVLNQIGKIYAKQDKLIDARKAFSRVIEEFPNAKDHVEIAQKMLAHLGGISGIKKISDQPPQQKTDPENRIRQTSEAGIGPLTRPNAMAIFSRWEISPVFGHNAKTLLNESGMMHVAEVRSSMASSGELLDDVVFNLGLRFYMIGDHEKAGACFEKTIELGIRNAELYTKLGVCYKRVGAWEFAHEIFQELAKIGPKDLDRLFDDAQREYLEGDREYGKRSLECLIGISSELDRKIKKLRN